MKTDTIPAFYLYTSEAEPDTNTPVIEVNAKG